MELSKENLEKLKKYKKRTIKVEVGKPLSKGYHKYKRGKLNKEQEDFCNNLVKTGGNKRLAYEMAYGSTSAKGTHAASSRLLRNPLVIERTNELLVKNGLPRDFFVKKLKDLCDAKTADGNNDNSTQFSSMKLGMELHGMIQKNPEVVQSTTINYNLNVDNLNMVLEKLSNVTKKMELQECPDGEILTR